MLSDRLLSCESFRCVMFDVMTGEIVLTSFPCERNFLEVINQRVVLASHRQELRLSDFVFALHLIDHKLRIADDFEFTYSSLLGDGYSPQQREPFCHVVGSVTDLAEVELITKFHSDTHVTWIRTSSAVEVHFGHIDLLLNVVVNYLLARYLEGMCCAASRHNKHLR
jgi:hypothetical protein